MNELFDYLNDITFNKVGNFDEKTYNSYMVNKYLAMRKDTIFFSNEMNKFNPPSIMQHDFYLNILPKIKRRFEYTKKEKNEDLDLICKHYNVRKEIAIQYLKLLNDDNINEIKNTYNTGGNKKKTAHK